MDSDDEEDDSNEDDEEYVFFILNFFSTNTNIYIYKYLKYIKNIYI